MSIVVGSNPGTGPYRRVYSKAGFAYASAEVVLPVRQDVQEAEGGLDANGQPLIRSNNDQCYIYLGGWGEKGGAVDAGLIHSPAYGHWSVFMSCEGIGLEVDPSNLRLAPGQTVFLEYSVPDDNAIQLNVTGLNTAGELKTVTMSMQPHAKYGWNSGGRGVIMKRMTTIGQTKPEDFTTGSFIRNVHWRECQIGVDRASARLWSSTHTGGYESYPATGQVRVQFRSSYDEIDAIELV